MQRLPGVALTLPDLLSLPPEAARQRVVEWVAQHGEPAYRSTQIVPRLWQRPVGTWDQASDLPAALRAALAAAFPLRRLALGARQLSSDGTEKYLWDLGDGEAIESVLIPEGKRRTLGILPGLAQLARRPEQFRLAVSLHAPTPELRHELMPIEKKYALAEVIAALGRFRRRVTLEYVLIGGRNDAPEHADRLAQLARPLGALVNLLPLHPGGAPDLTPSTRAQMLAFERRLKRHGVEAVLRRSRGLDISAACGQLRVELEARRKVGAEEHARVE